MHWVAYSSDESGAAELYVRPFLDSSGNLASSQTRKWQISANGINVNSFLRWSRDGKALYYQSSDNKMISVDINAEGSTLGVGRVDQLFEIKSKGLILFQDVTADGQQFLFLRAVGGESAMPVSLITNWDAEARKK